MTVLNVLSRGAELMQRKCGGVERRRGLGTFGWRDLGME